MLQFSLRNLLVAVAAVAVGIAALINANSWWASLLWAAVLLMLVFAGLLAFLRREAKRAFWSGYVVGGSLYLVLLMYSVPQFSQTDTRMPYAPLNHDSLATTKVILLAYSWFPTSKTTPYLPSQNAPTSGFGGMSPVGAGGMGFTGGPPNPSYVDPQAFIQIGHALWMFFISWLVGTVAYSLFRSRERSSSAPVTTPR